MQLLAAPPPFAAAVVRVGTGRRRSTRRVGHSRPACSRAGASSSSDECLGPAAKNDALLDAVVSRRQSIGFAAAVAAAATAFGSANPAFAAYESQTQPSGGGAAEVSSSAPSTELSLYKRSFRQRFETSISAGTHDYSFKFPKDTWKPDIVSLNDGKLYGVDLRFSSDSEGKVCTHVLPFVDADSLKDVGTPDEALDRFVELIGAFWNENGFGVPGGNAGSLKSTKTVEKDGVVYYEYELTKPHNLISAAVTDGQLYVINASAVSERQWQQGQANLRNIVSSFYVPP